MEMIHSFATEKDIACRLIKAEEDKLMEKAATAKAAEEAQAKAAEANAEEGKDNKQKGRGGGKKKGKEIATSLVLGRGSRLLYDYLILNPCAI